jgi:CRISPR system Cascade subunit CasE
MIASILKLSRVDSKALRITDDYSLHRVIYGLFDDIRSEEEKRASVPSGFLFADKGGDTDGRLILLLSDREPKMPEHGTLQSKIVPPTFLDHDRYRFEVIINPTRRENVSRKLVPIRKPDEISTWFTAKAPFSWGFSVNPESLDIRVLPSKQFSKKSHQLTLGGAVISGKFRVEDRLLFIKSFKNGIGRGRAFGFGLLQVAPLISSINS